MSVSAETLRLLMAAGVTGETLLAIVESMERAFPPPAGSLSPGAMRTRQWRERLEATGLTAEEWRVTSMRIIARDEGACQYCGANKGRMACDHVTPLSQGGSSADENLVCACHTCNSGKSGNSLERWLGEAKAAEWRHHRETSPRDISHLGEPTQVVTPSLPSLRSEELEEKGSEPKGSSQKKISGHFEQFWEAYPRKVGKAEARKAFDVAWRKLPAFDEMAVLVGGLERAKAGWVGRQRQFIPHASKWLRGEHWADEPDLPEPERQRTLTDEIGERNDEAWRLTQRLLEAERSGDRHRNQGRIGSSQHPLQSPADGNQPTGAVVAGLVRGLGRIPH